MADTWISLNDQYVKTSGDSEINGTLKIINANTGTSSGLLVNQPGSTTELYNVGDEIKSLRDSVSSFGAWRFSEKNGSGMFTWGSTDWHDQTSAFSNLDAGVNNWSQFFSTSGAKLTTKVQGTWKFTQVLHGYSPTRLGLGIFANGKEQQSNFVYSNGAYISCVNIALLRDPANAVYTFKEYSDATGAAKNKSAHLTYTIVEYLGPDPA